MKMANFLRSCVLLIVVLFGASAPVSAADYLGSGTGFEPKEVTVCKTEADYWSGGSSCSTEVFYATTVERGDTLSNACLQALEGESGVYTRCVNPFRARWCKANSITRGECNTRFDAEMRQLHPTVIKDGVQVGGDLFLLPPTKAIQGAVTAYQASADLAEKIKAKDAEIALLREALADRARLLEEAEQALAAEKERADSAEAELLNVGARLALQATEVAKLKRSVEELESKGTNVAWGFSLLVGALIIGLSYYVARALHGLLMRRAVPVEAEETEVHAMGTEETEAPPTAKVVASSGADTTVAPPPPVKTAKKKVVHKKAPARKRPAKKRPTKKRAA